MAANVMLDHKGFEIAMRACFPLGWYWPIGRMPIVRAASGKSPVFVLFV